eukprot:69027-Pyramimonas_sp.AAC.1
MAAAQGQMLARAFGGARLQPAQVTALSALVAAQPRPDVSKGWPLEKLGNIVAPGEAIGLRRARGPVGEGRRVRGSEAHFAGRCCDLSGASQPNRRRASDVDDDVAHGRGRSRGREIRG